MSRPMPGPPEKYQLLGPTVIVWEGGIGYYYHPSVIDAKRMTGAECAAEFWRAVFDHARPLAANTFVPTPEWDRSCQEVDTWRRFKDTPHALEPTP